MEWNITGSPDKKADAETAYAVLAALADAEGKRLPPKPVLLPILKQIMEAPNKCDFKPRAVYPTRREEIP